MKKTIAVLIVLICIFSFIGCQRITKYYNIHMVADVYYDNETLLQEAADALLSADISIPIYIYPITSKNLTYYQECEIGNIRFEADVVNLDLFEAECQELYNTIAPLFDELNFWRICVYRDEIIFVLEYKGGFAAELFYVYDENADSYSTLDVVKDEMKINNYWYAVKIYEPDGL